LKEGFIKLRAEDCKTNEGRLVPLNRELVDMFQAMPGGLPMTPVFLFQGHGMAEMKKSFHGLQAGRYRRFYLSRFEAHGAFAPQALRP
jgi:hypothetical protein